MKKLVLSSIVFILILQGMSAQVGVKLGANFSGISYDKENANVELGTRLSYQIGVFGDFNITPMFALRPGIIYNTKGNQISFPDSLGEITNALNYLDIPLNVAFKFKMASAGLVFEAGPYIGIYLSGKSDDNDIPDESIKSTDVGVNASLSVEFRNLGVGLGYSRGLGSLNEDNTTLTFEGKNKVITLFGVILF